MTYLRFLILNVALVLSLLAFVPAASAYVAEAEFSNWGRTYLTEEYCRWDGMIAYSERKHFFAVNSKGVEQQGCYSVDEKFVHLQVLTSKGVKAYAIPKNQFRFNK